MPYEYLDEIATADVAFEAWGGTVEEMFKAAAEATMNVMVEDLDSIADRERRKIEVRADAIDMLLFELLEDLIFYKDARMLLLRVASIQIRHPNESEGEYSLTAEAYGEKIDPQKHQLPVDVKAVTLHRFQVEQTPGGWKSTVILDI